MALTPVALYLELGHLAAEIPDLAAGPITPELEQWLGRASTLVESSGSLADTIQLRTAIGNLNGTLRARNAETIAEIIQRALAKAELKAPPKAQGMFIVATNAFNSFAAVRKVLRTARSDVLLVAPDADAKVLTDFAVLAPDGVIVRLLADEAEHKKSLELAARHWLRRFGRSRPLFVRVAAAGTLADTLILVDGVVAWALRRSFNKVAKSPYAESGQDTRSRGRRDDSRICRAMAGGGADVSGGVISSRLSRARLWSRPRIEALAQGPCGGIVGAVSLVSCFDGGGATGKGAGSLRPLVPPGGWVADLMLPPCSA